MTLINILYYLATNESKQIILKNEINKLLPDNNFELNSDHLNSMPYLKACIKEAYRMYPIGAGIIRYLTKDAVLSGYQIPKGVCNLYNLRNYHQIYMIMLIFCRLYYYSIICAFQ